MSASVGFDHGGVDSGGREAAWRSLLRAVRDLRHQLQGQIGATKLKMVWIPAGVLSKFGASRRGIPEQSPSHVTQVGALRFSYADIERQCDREDSLGSEDLAPLIQVSPFLGAGPWRKSCRPPPAAASGEGALRV